MSLILDALRKSEAERRRGQAPDLFASLPPPAAPRGPELPRFWPGLAIIALVLAAGFVLWPDRGQATRAAAESVPGDEPGASAPDFAPPSRPALASSGTPAMPAPPTLPASAPRTVATAAVPDAAAPTASAAAAKPARVEQLQLPAASAAMPPTPARMAIAAAPMPPPAEAGDVESLPPIAVLEASARAALPPLKLSMHVWNNEPDKRFAIIDGTRVTDGSTVGSSIVEEVRRDGVVLNIDGRRFLLPRP